MMKISKALRLDLDLKSPYFKYYYRMHSSTYTCMHSFNSRIEVNKHIYNVFIIMKMRQDVMYRFILNLNEVPACRLSQ